MARNAMHGLQRVERDEKGSVTIMSALFMAAMLGAAGFALDAATLRLEKRAAQSAVDLAAIAAAAHMDVAESAAKSVLRANKITGVTKLAVNKGNYSPASNVDPRSRFRAGAGPANGVQVKLEKVGRQYFSQIFAKRPMKIVVVGVAASSAEATFSVGSRLIAVGEGLANALIKGLLGGNVTLTANDYNALANAHLSAVDFVKALALETNVTAGTYDDVLQSSANVGDVLNAIANVTGETGYGEARSSVITMLSQTNAPIIGISLRKLIDLGRFGKLAIGSSAPGLDASFNALELITSAAVLSGGGRQATIDLAGAVPGLLSLTMNVAIGEPMQTASWAKLGDAGSTVYTAQTRIKLVAEIAGSGALLGTRVKLPVYLTLAHARGRLDSVTCPSNRATEVAIAVKPGVAEAWLGEVTPESFTQFNVEPVVADAALVNALLVKVTGKAHALIGGLNETTLAFDQSDITAHKIKSTSAQDLGASLIQSLLANAQLKATILGLGIGTPASVTNLVATILGGVAKPIDDVLHSLLTMLGVHVGEADVRVHGAQCRSSGLVD